MIHTIFPLPLLLPLPQSLLPPLLLLLLSYGIEQPLKYHDMMNGTTNTVSASAVPAAAATVTAAGAAAGAVPRH